MGPGGGQHDHGALDIEVLPLLEYAGGPPLSPDRFLAGLQLNMPGENVLPHLAGFDSWPMTCQHMYGDMVGHLWARVLGQPAVRLMSCGPANACWSLLAKHWHTPTSCFQQSRARICAVEAYI